MGDSARIHNVESLKDARAALAEFAERAAAALASVDADIQRVSQWLSVDRPTYWKLELRHREQKVESIKGEIMRKKIIAAPDPASVVLEERRLDRARERVEEARRRMENVRRWAPIWDREAMLYKGSTRSLTEALHRDIPRGMAVLAKMMESVEDYAALAPPPGADPDAPPPPPAPPAPLPPPSVSAGGSPGAACSHPAGDPPDAGAEDPASTDTSEAGGSPYLGTPSRAPRPSARSAEPPDAEEQP